jgi:hypothetical protein
MTDELLDECERRRTALDATPRWRWFRRWRLTNAWLSAVSALQARETETAQQRLTGY